MLVQLGEWIGPEHIRSIQFGIFSDLENPYLRSGPWGNADHRSIEQRIHNVRDHKSRRVIEAVPPFTPDDMPQAWSHFMALGAGTHPWPDANHRTAFLAFDLAMRHALQTSVGLDAADAKRMVEHSKRYRKLFASFESHLHVRGIR